VRIQERFQVRLKIFEYMTRRKVNFAAEPIDFAKGRPFRSIGFLYFACACLLQK
jgi:hypothetical protein